MVKNRINNRGFTLVELVISIAILALIIVAISGVMFSNNNVFRKNKSDLDVQNTALDTLNVIENDVMQAKHLCIVTTGGDIYLTGSDKNLVAADAIGPLSFTDAAGTGQVFQYNSGTGRVPLIGRIDEISSKGADAEDVVYDNLTDANRAQVDSFYQKIKMMSSDEVDVYEDFFNNYPVGPSSMYESFGDLTGPTDLDVESILIVYPTYVSGVEQTCVVKYDFSTPGQIIMSNSATGSGNPEVYTEYVDSSGYTTVTVDSKANTLTFNIDFERNNRVYHGTRVVSIRNAHVLNDAD